MLKKFVETLQANGEHSLKVIFLSSDKTEHDMWKYIYDAHGDWLVLAYGARDVKERLERQYQVSGIPNLVVIDPVGRQAVRDARGEVMAASTSSTQVLTTYLGWKSAAGAAPAQPREPAFNELPPGQRVRICGLTGAPEHNGMEGKIKGFDVSKQRYVIDLGEKSLSLRAANLLQLLAVQVRCGEKLEDWRDVQVDDFDADSGEFSLRGEGDESTVRAKLGDPEGPVLKADTRIVVHGLQAESAQQWNDRIGKVLEYDQAAERYLVQVAAGSQLKIRPGNLRIFPLP